MKLTPVKTLPARDVHEPTADPDVRVEGGKRVTNTGYAALLDRFRLSTHDLARIDAPDFPARVIYRGLRSARASAPDTFGHIDVILRGGAVYVSKRGTAGERKTSRQVAALALTQFDASGAATLHFPGKDHTFYRQLQYRRTALGLGHIRVIRADGGVTLVNTLIGTPADAV